MSDLGRPGYHDPGVRAGIETSVIVLGFGPEPYLIEALDALVTQLGGRDELVLVDNGIHTRVRDSLPTDPRITVVGSGDNLGFAGGCVLGVESSVGEVVVFVNSDAIVRPGALRTLTSVVRGHPEYGLVSGCLRLADQPHLVNSVGNPLQYLGLTWAGRCGEPAEQHLRSEPVCVATGGLFALSRDTWQLLGGFDPVYFAYHEDTDLSLRSWLRGLPVVVEPAAIADHHYEFSRNPRKFYLLERNRLITVLTDYPAALLRRVLPVLILVEPALFVMALLQGWGRQKLRAWWWLATHRSQLRRRRRTVQATVQVSAVDIADLMVARIEPPMVAAPPGMWLLNAGLERYWRWASGRLGGSTSRHPRQRDQVDDRTDSGAEGETEDHPPGQLQGHQ